MAGIIIHFTATSSITCPKTPPTTHQKSFSYGIMKDLKDKKY